MTTATRTTYHACNLCEAICGLAIEHTDKQVISIKGDKNDPFSRGHICPKAMALQDIHSDPSRLRQPMRKGKNGFEPISWADAFHLIEVTVGSIREQYGDDSVALYLGNPTVHNYGALLFQRFIQKSLNTRNRFAATSVDQLPHHVAASQMFGHGLLIPVPDIDHTQYMLILGANPAASNGSLMTSPDVKNRIKSIRERGGKVVLIDPRETETAKLVNEHYFIRPGTDAYLFAGMLYVIFEEGLTRLENQQNYVKNVDTLRDVVSGFAPELMTDATGVRPETIRQLARELATADRAVVYGRMGVSTQPHGGVCQWLINAINLVTGNLDRQGGQMFTSPAIRVVGRRGTIGEYGRWHSRVRSLPEFEGELPVAVMAEEMLTSGEGQIRALITNAGNPVLSVPNGRQLDRALTGLDFFVALDIYINETTRHADLILPSPTGLENDHYDLVFNMLAVRNIAKYSPQVFQPVDGSLYDWQIMKEIAKRLMPKACGLAGSIRRRISLALLDWLTPRRILNLGLSIGPYGVWRNLFRKGLNLKRLEAEPHGVDLGKLQPQLPAALRTPDKKIDAAPKRHVERLLQIYVDLTLLPHEAKPSGSNDAPTFSLIGRRHLRSNNSWMHNSQRLIKGPNRCTLMMHSDDAARWQLADGEDVTVESRVGKIQLPLEVTDSIMPGVVSMPHGFGHDRDGIEIPVAQANAGASINDLTDDLTVDPLTGNAAFSAQRVSVSRACSLLD